MSGGFVIREDDLRGPEIAALLQEHLASVALHSPPESIHALDLEGLRAPGVTFWTAWDGAVLAGCGALKELDTGHGEIKSMRTSASHLRRGVASAVLGHLVEVARKRGYIRLSLETGSMDAFLPARSLYARFGFQECGPFAEYVDDPNSVFMTMVL
ncbi:MAG: GNAT family N-acetyltransferase [Phycisphaerales bacterium]|nr:GNAT family N-acetyltransferase [Phycisphaerales bacterium]